MELLFGDSHGGSLGKKSSNSGAKKGLIRDFDKADQIEAKVERP